MTIKGVTFTDGGKKVYSNKEDVVNNNCCERVLNELDKNSFVVRTSTYADFAAETLPTGKVNITGVFTRYNNKWQVIIRKASDVENAK
jgi:DNA/RNA endonuclease YhcR with UshA esterase domain